MNGYEGDTGEVVFAGGEKDAVMSGIGRFSAGIVARGRIYVAGDDKVYAFALPSRTSAEITNGTHPDVR